MEERILRREIKLRAKIRWEEENNSKRCESERERERGRPKRQLQMSWTGLGRTMNYSESWRIYIIVLRENEGLAGLANSFWNPMLEMLDCYEFLYSC